MTTTHRSTCLAALVIASAAAAQPITSIETFDDGQNHTDWTWDRTPLGEVVPSGGNPGGYFQSALMAVPALFTSHDTFTGNFLDRRVGSIGGDLSTIEFASGPGEIAVALVHANGTPGDLFDDTVAHFVTSITSPTNPDFGWVSFDAPIPWDAPTTPAGWVLTGALPFQPPGVEWSELITNVDEVIISWHSTLEPVLLFDVIRGADNLRITYNVPAPAAAPALALLGLAGMGRSRRR